MEVYNLEGEVCGVKRILAKELIDFSSLELNTFRAQIINRAPTKTLLLLIHFLEMSGIEWLRKYESWTERSEKAYCRYGDV
jgi:hypothetical protein